MKNYILLGIGIGMILSGSIFTYIENKEYSTLETRIREEVKKEFEQDKKVEELIDKEFKSYLKEEKKTEEKKEEKVEPEKIKVVKKEVDFKIKEDKKVEVDSNKEKKEEELKVVKGKKKEILKKFEPIIGEENIYSIQFRSGSNKEDIEKIKEKLNGIIDTKVEFIQGYYRVFAKDLYSEKYSKDIVDKIKKQFSLTPVIRSPKQMDYLILGPKKYKEKYDKKEEKQVDFIEAVVKNNEENLEIKKDVVPAQPTREEISSKEIIKKVEEKEKTKIEKVENITGSEIKTSEKVINKKDIKLVFLENGEKFELDKIKKNIGDLMELEIKNEKNVYTVKSKEIFTENVAEDLIGKLKLLFDMDVKEEKVNLK